MYRWPAVVLAACLCAGAAAAAATAPGAAAAPAQMSMDQAVKLAEQRYHARVVKAEAQRSGAQIIYVLRLLNDSGKVWTVHVDAASGAMQ
jgi:uncharacterized membrane protein YkoI